VPNRLELAQTKVDGTHSVMGAALVAAKLAHICEPVPPDRLLSQPLGASDGAIPVENLHEPFVPMVVGADQPRVNAPLRHFFSRLLKERIHLRHRPGRGTAMSTLTVAQAPVSSRPRESEEGKSRCTSTRPAGVVDIRGLAIYGHPCSSFVPPVVDAVHGAGGPRWVSAAARRRRKRTMRLLAGRNSAPSWVHQPSGGFQGPGHPTIRLHAQENPEPERSGSTRSTSKHNRPRPSRRFGGTRPSSATKFPYRRTMPRRVRPRRPRSSTSVRRTRRP